MEQLDVKKVDALQDSKVINFCQEVSSTEEMVINYTYTEMGRQLMILDLGAPVSVSGISWMTQYLAKFDLKVEDMKSVKCNQPFRFGPSRRYVSNSLVELPILVSRKDGKEDVLVVQTYLVDAEVPFLCGKQTLKAWKFKIDSTKMTLEISTRVENDGATKVIEIIETTGGHYGVILETKKRPSSNILFVEDDAGILLVED